MKKFMGLFILFVSMINLVQGSDRESLVKSNVGYHEEFQMPKKEVILLILKTHLLEIDEFEFIEKAILKIAEKRLSKDDISEILHDAGGYGKKNIRVCHYDNAAEALILEAAKNEQKLKKCTIQ